MSTVAILTVSQDTPWEFCPPLFDRLKLHPILVCALRRKPDQLKILQFFELIKISQEFRSGLQQKGQSRHRRDAVELQSRSDPHRFVEPGWDLTQPKAGRA
jgi:hypothetical protein